jgi:hypothetical protein
MKKFRIIVNEIITNELMASVEFEGETMNDASLSFQSTAHFKGIVSFLESKFKVVNIQLRIKEIE